MREKEDRQIRATRRILAELADMAEASSMTGVLRGGTKEAARTYNRALELLTDRGIAPDGMFEPVDPEGVDFGQIGVQCRLLMATITEEEEEEREEHGRDKMGAIVALAPFLESHDLGRLVRERMEGSSRIPDGILIGLAPFLDKDTLGEMVRRKLKSAPPEPPAPPASPTPAASTPARDLRPAVHDPQPAELETLAGELRRPDLTIEERQQIAIRLAELAYDQSTRGE
jgi:hypothetical protein